MLSEELRLYPYNLQFFAESGGGEKTEDATQKKLTDAREEGQVAKSKELVTALSLFALFIGLKVFVSSIGKGLLESFNKYYIMIGLLADEGEEFGTIKTAKIVETAFLDSIRIAVPLLIAGYAVVVFGNLLQVKWKPSTKIMKPKLSKFNPINGLKNMFKLDKLVDLLKEAVKVAIVGYVAYTTIKDKLNVLFLLPDIEMNAGVLLVGNMIIELGLKVSGFYLIIGFADYFYQKLKFKKDMRMTKQEVKDEFKQQEGDPQVKGRIRSKMREAAQRRMMQKLPEADVVITNPTHFACAVKYDKEVAEAPILIAKGADYVALKIKEKAKENQIPIVENKALARMLYYNVELDAEIPKELYQMTAEVLAYVYSLKNKTKSA